MPSLLEKNTGELFGHIERMRSYYSFFQIDIADGDFVPNRTLQPEDIGAYLRTNSPPVKDLVFDIHLMVRDYASYMQRILRLRLLLPVRCVLVHFGAHLHEEDTKKAPFPVGLVLNPGDEIDDVVKNYSSLDIFPEIQLMTVEPGFQGSPFIGQSLNKIEQLRNNNYRNEILIDGAVNPETASIMSRLPCKPDTICPGSYLTRAPDLARAAKTLAAITEEA